jgi:branched-chain amino acid transport system substrate-binding protein
MVNDPAGRAAVRGKVTSRASANNGPRFRIALEERAMDDRPRITIGYAAPLTGDQAVVGVPMGQCAELAVILANERGHLPFQLAFQAIDDLATESGALAAAHRFIADPTVIGIVGHKNSGSSAVGAPLYHAAGIPQITPSSTNTQLSRYGYRTFFRVCAHDAVQGAVAARYAVRTLGARRIAVVHDRTDYGRPLAEAVQASARAEGADVVLLEDIAVGQTDFAATAARVRETAPDLVYFALTEIESSLLAGQLRGAGIASILFGTDGSRESPFVQLAGPAAEGSYQTYAGAVLDRVPAAKPFVRKFESRLGRTIPTYGGEAYDAASLLIAALGRAPIPDRGHVLDALRTMPAFDGVTGRIEFEPDGNRRDPEVSIWRIEQGVPRLVGEPAGAR